MSLAELTDAALPRLSSRFLLRRRLQRTGALKTIRRRQRSFVRSVILWQHSQYYLPVAARDLRTAAAQNEDIFLGTAVITAIVVLAVASISAQLILQAFLSMSYLNDLTGFSVVPLFIAFAGVLVTLAAWIAAWLCNSLSIAIMDSMTRRRVKTLRSTLRRGLRLASRTATSWLQLLVILFAPIALLGMTSLGAVHLLGDHGLLSYFYPVVLTGVSGILWLLYAGTSFALSPIVALFRPELSLRDTLNHSRQLVLRRGRPFILALYLTAAALLGAAYGLTMLLANVFGSGVDAVFYAAIFAVIIGFNLMLSVLYRKRRLARTN